VSAFGGGSNIGIGLLVGMQLVVIIALEGKMCCLALSGGSPNPSASSRFEPTAASRLTRTIGWPK
jgi:hypothetical protein